MRCKNCGTYNDDNRYICETCGSPLYDEDEVINDDKTQTFNAVQETDSNTDTVPEIQQQPAKEVNAQDKKDPKDKKSIIVISILVVVLIAIVASIIVVAQSKSKEDETESSSVSTSQSTTEEKTTEYTTERTTEKTTERTTENTTEKTTVTTWYINVSSSGGGTVSGGGQFDNGEKVTLTATADNGYVFDGWYSSGVKVSNSTTYTFTANENVSYSAQFSPVPTTEAPSETAAGEEAV